MELPLAIATLTMIRTEMTALMIAVVDKHPRRLFTLLSLNLFQKCGVIQCCSDMHQGCHK